MSIVVLTPEMLGLTDGRANALRGPDDAYARVPLVFRATRIRCNALLKIPYHLYRDDGTTEVESEQDEADWPFPKTPLRKLLWRTRAAGLLTGAGYVLKRSNTVQVRELQWLNPTTMRVDWDYTRKQIVFNQTHLGATYGPWSEKEVLYIPEFTLRDDVQPGDCPASVAMGSAQLSHYITRMASTFFESGAMPVTLLSSEDGFGTDTPKIEEYFRRLMQGIRNAFRVVAVRGKGVKFDRLQFPLNELATPELREQSRKDVALAFEIPVTLLDDDANYATAKEHKRSFYDETVIPDADVYAEEWNAQLLHDLGLHLEFKPEEMDLYQDDERESADAANTFTDMLGKISDFDTFAFVTKTYGIEYDETLAKKVFANKEKRADEMRSQMAARPAATPDAPLSTDNPAANPNSDAPAAKTALGADLAKWERRAAERLQKGGSERRALAFKSEAIPPTLHAAIAGALEAATGPEDVRGVFANARTWANYP